MEDLEAISGENWSTFEQAMPTDESEFMAELLGGYPFSMDHELSSGMSSLFWSEHESGPYYCLENANFNFWSQDHSTSSTSSTTSIVPKSSSEGYYFASDANATMASSLENDPVCQLEESINLIDEMNGNDVQKTCTDTQEKERPPKKKPRATAKVQASTKKSQSKKAQKGAGVASSCEVEDGNAAMHGQSTSCNGSHDSGSGTFPALNVNVKARASRGSATDPQSLYARKRRERINERLRILQNLVPNGTKVDISTMLEEAVHYVKFLQLQIKLLSSDELWMYAPIAYNGVNIGLDLKISPGQQ